MNIVKRTSLSIFRQWGKTVLLFSLLVLLGSLVAMAISISQAIVVAEVNLRRQIPAVATVIHDNDGIAEYIERYGDWPEWHSSLTAQMKAEIGSLPYVRIFDYVFPGDIYSRELILSNDPTPYIGLLHGMTENEVLSMLDMTFGLEHIEVFNLHGVYNPMVLDIEAGVLELTAGRVFTEEEMEANVPVALISEAFANTNGLTVGSTFMLENIAHDFLNEEACCDVKTIYADENIVRSEEITFEVIGTFTPTAVMDRNANFVDVVNHMELNNRIYVPIEVAKSGVLIWMDHLAEVMPEQLAEFGPYHGYFWYENVIFILYDSLYLDDFSEAVAEILPGFWLVDDLSSAYRDMTASMATLGEISDWIMIGCIGASLIILGLLIVLFLYDRKHEIGIYLALGEKKMKIVFQVLLEVLTIAIVAIAISLFAGNLLAQHFSQEILRNEMINNTTPLNLEFGGHNDLNSMGFGFWMTHEEMIEAYSVALDGTTVIIFIGVSIGMILISTLLPIIYLVKFNPKEIIL